MSPRLWTNGLEIYEVSDHETESFSRRGKISSSLNIL